MAQANDIAQYALELVNRFRLNPAGAFDHFIVNATTGEAYDPGVTAALAWFQVDLTALATQLDTLTAAPPLGWSDQLATAAAAHNTAMQAADEQSHQVSGEVSLGVRVDATGYNWSALAENVYAFTENADHAHAGFVIDWGYDTGETSATRAGGDGIQDPAGHRDALTTQGFSQIGIDFLADASGATRVGPWLTTQVLGKQVGGGPLLVGVVHADGDQDRAYSQGEGVAGVSLMLDTAGVTTSAAAGGFSIETTAGTHDLTFDAGGTARTITVRVTVGTDNIKIDLSDAGALSVSADAEILSWASGLRALGTAGLTLRGGYAHELIEGNSGDNKLFGGRGEDKIKGGAGFDEIYGGGFSDALFGGSEGDKLTAGKGWDRLYGGQGDDRLFGEAGNDQLYGGLGRDRLVGGNGNDRLTGGPGRDVFVFDAADGTDRITDWESRDRIDISGSGVDLSDVSIGISGADAVLLIAQTTVIIEGAADSFNESYLLV